MLDTEFYSVVEDAAGVRAQLHRLSGDGSWSPPLPEGVRPPAGLTLRSTLAAGLLAARSRVNNGEVISLTEAQEAKSMKDQINELVAQITRAQEEAKAAVPGAKMRLKELQARYRSSGASIVRDGGTCQLNEAGSSSSRPRLALVDRPRRRAPERSARPDWMLTEPEPESWRLR